VVKRKENSQMNNDIQTDSDKAVGSGDLLGIAINDIQKTI
jgi:hypothetical protein